MTRTRDELAAETAPSVKAPLWTRDYILACCANFRTGRAFYELVPGLPLYLTGQLQVSSGWLGWIMSIYVLAAIISRPYKEGYPRVLDGEVLIIEQCHGHMGRSRGGHAHQRHAVVKQRTFHLAHGIGIVSAVQQCLQTVGVVGDVHNVPFLVVYEQQSLL